MSHDVRHFMIWRKLNYTVEMHILYQTGNNNSIIAFITPAWPHQRLVCVSHSMSFISITKIATMMYGMYLINGVYGPEPRSLGGNISPNPHVPALIPRPAFNMTERMCQHQLPVPVQKTLCNQFIHHHISGRGVFGINHFRLRNFAVVAIRFFATAARGSIMAIIHRWSVMIYGSLQVEFMETKYNSLIHKYAHLSLVKYI